jgi:ADP-L-glycero-D-manno-heptose 6-epimerase
LIVVTGGAGFIGSNIVRALNGRGSDDILVVDDLSDGRKFVNLRDSRISDYLDRDDFRERLLGGRLARPEAIIHQGACAVTTEWDGRYMMNVNYRYSVDVLEYCLEQKVPLIYASSAAVYGVSARFSEDDPILERPLNIYGYSKLLFDRYVRRRLPVARSQIVGLRYFNVYGPGEAFKGNMASVAYHLHCQRLESAEVRLFEGHDGYEDGEQRRDFVYVEDVAKINLWFLGHPEVSGVFNVGTGKSFSFNEVARAVLAWHGGGEIRYIPFPEELKSRYQSFTQADIRALRAIGYDEEFLDVDVGVKAYLDRFGARP